MGKDLADISSLIVVTKIYYNIDLMCMEQKVLIVVIATLCNVITKWVATKHSI